MGGLWKLTTSIIAGALIYKVYPLITYKMAKRLASNQNDKEEVKKLQEDIETTMSMEHQYNHTKRSEKHMEAQRGLNTKFTEEITKVSSEVERFTEENKRFAEDIEMFASENARVTAECARVSAENTRVSAEVDRVTAENAELKQDLEEVKKQYSMILSDSAEDKKAITNLTAQMED